MANAIISGAPSIKMVMCWISWCKSTVINARLSAFFVSYYKGLHYAPRRIVTDKLRSYSAARKEVLPDAIHDSNKWQNNRAELSRQPTRQRERQMRRFKSAGQAQRFLSAHNPINNLFHVGRHHMKAAHYRLFRDRAFALWQEVTCVQNAG